MKHTTEFALKERIKELTCLYGIARASEDPGASIPEVLEQIVKLLPPAWQYPDVAEGRIMIDNTPYTSENFREGMHSQKADIVINGVTRGYIEVTYLEEKPDLDEGPFLKEERNLINTVSREVALIIERRHAEEENKQLQMQLMHSDRLATIGQLAAGVAHELNEPLGNILGFAELTLNSSRIEDQARHDIRKIVKASLHAREIVKKLLLFSRQMPPRKTELDLNEIVREGLSFFEHRCRKEGIKVTCNLASGIPDITADPSQLQQMLVNIVVNAIQSMPRGGSLTIETSKSDDSAVKISISDTGTGIEKNALNRIFVPFYTTKDINEGTGLGLSVTHGIVTSHGGTIKVSSKPGEGTRFEIILPIHTKDNRETHE